MRYFKYPNTEITERKVLKAQRAKKEKRILRRNNTLEFIAKFLFVVVGGSCFIGCLVLITLIRDPESLFLVVLSSIVKCVLILLSAVVSFIVGGFVFLIIYGMIKFSKQTLKRHMLSEACAPLRDYYGLQDPYIVTKCYNSSDEKFVNHDVCVFIAGDELRITANLQFGFFHGERDLGCYAFRPNEVNLSKKQDGRILTAELKAGDADFLLGYRAKSFIEKNFISKTE